MRAHVDVRDSNLTFFARGAGVSVGVGVGFEGAFFIVFFVLPGRVMIFTAAMYG